MTMGAIAERGKCTVFTVTDFIKSTGNRVI